MLLSVIAGVYVYGVFIALATELLYQKYYAALVDGRQRSFWKSLAFSASLTYFHPVYLGLNAVRKTIQKEHKNAVRDTA